MDPTPPKPRRPWVTGVLLLVVLAAIVVTGQLYRRELARNNRQHAVDQLGAVAALKADQIAEWRLDLVRDAEAVAQSPLVARVAAHLRSGTAAPGEAAELARWLASMERHLQHHGVLLLDPEQRVLLNIGRHDQEPGPRARTLAADAVRRNVTVVSDLVPGDHSGQLGLYVGVPIQPLAAALPVGVLLVYVDPELGLFPSVARRAGSFATAETILVGREGDKAEVFSHVRHRDQARLHVQGGGHQTCHVKVVTRPGAPTTGGAHAYQGVPVLAAARVVEGTPWVVVAKVDTAEANGSATLLSQFIAALTVLLVLLTAGAIALVHSRQRAGQYRRSLAAQVEHLVLLKRTEYLMRHASDAIFLSSEDGRLLDANERAMAMYGYSRAELLGMTGRDLRAPEALGNFERQWRHADERAGLVYETVHRRKDGSAFPVEISVRVIEVDGQRLRQAIMRDVSERRSLEARVRTSERLASVGALAGGVAHEINNPLACVIANVDFVLEELAPAPGDAGAELRAALGEARQAARRVRDIVRMLGGLTGQGLGGGAPTDLRRVIAAAAEATRRDLHGRARLVLDLCAAPPVLAAEEALTQVFRSLLVNAAQAVLPGHPDENAVTIALRHEAGRVLVEVRDTGCGMSPEVMARLFDPFFSTKGVGAGMGLSLALCHGVVSSLGGAIHVESAAGKGSTFRVALPAAAPGAEVAAPGGKAAAPAGTTVTDIAAARPAA